MKPIPVTIQNGSVPAYAKCINNAESAYMLLKLSYTFPIATHNYMFMRKLSLFVAILILGSTTIIPVEVLAATNKNNAEIKVSVKNLPEDWRADSGSTVALYDNKTGERIIGYRLIKGKATFKNLKQNQGYYIVLSVDGFSEIRKSIKIKKKKSEVIIKLPKEESSETQNSMSSKVTVSPMLPGVMSGTTQITQGTVMEVWVNVTAPISGTVQTYLVNSDKKVQLLLASSRYEATGGTELTLLKQRSGVIPTTVPMGSGYKILAKFVSDDNTLKKQEESFGLAFVTSAISGSPRITSFSGPSTLRVGEEGTWKLEASPSIGQTASCRIWWGQDPLIVSPQARGHSCRESSLYPAKATYKKAGTYQVAAEIRQSDQQVSTEWLKVIVK